MKNIIFAVQLTPPHAWGKLNQVVGKVEPK